MALDLNIANDGIKRETTDRFLCPGCGGNMTFNPESQSLQCPYCQNKIDIAGNNELIMEYDFNSKSEKPSENWGSEKRVIHCESCGAETVLDATCTAEFCAFCGSSHIVSQKESAGIAPESLIPFKIPQKKAAQSFTGWIKKRFFAPNSLKTDYQAKKVTGVYIPCWTYDSDTYSVYTAEAGTYYYVTETDWVEENGQRKMVTRQVRKIRWWPTSGTYSEYFNDILINASQKIDNNLMKKLEPFSLNELNQYKPEFLSGFHADRYSVGLNEGWQEAAILAREKIRGGIISKISADEVRNLNVQTSYNNIKYKHILLPLWISAYTYKNKVYQYMVNGQTGEVQGYAPVSPWKVAITVVLSLIVIGIIAYILL